MKTCAHKRRFETDRQEQTAIGVCKKCGEFLIWHDGKEIKLLSQPWALSQEMLSRLLLAAIYYPKPEEKNSVPSPL